MRTFSDAEWAGLWVKFPTGFADRLLAVARADLARQLRYIADDADPAGVLETWLADRERPAKPLPVPHAEPGDLLAKIGRAEFWTFTMHGWRELAPVELVREQRFTDDGEAEQAEPAKVVFTGPPSHGPDVFPHGQRGARCFNENATRPRPEPLGRKFPPAIAEALAELLVLQNALDMVLDACEQPDLGIDDRLHAFRDGIGHARLTLLDVATRNAR